MTTILFPTDFSTNANHALEYAVNIANATGASIHLLHVYTPLVSPANSIHAFITDETDDIKKTATEKLAVLQTIAFAYLRLCACLAGRQVRQIYPIYHSANF